ncbi:hypothetical protein NUU61_009696 [Penicillium alfredii]|uniref:DUF1279 domain-containing protein n=1 Tax=Penicillium alfredii TaxID=1506179 RepID=A0A9W9EGK3_9EURO|nr:uncharacterized protein NUU61_009696 [Penicillium alfredii]KAJ5081432.1 hypothetical protein NUU61_009696 [Penicillium alfredii]
MPLRHLLRSRWNSSAELLQPALTSGSHLPSTRPMGVRNSPILSFASRATRRTLTTVNSTSRVTTRTRPGPTSHQFLKQRLNRRFNSGSSGSGPQPEPEHASLSQRLRKLSREYGWATLGVYLALSALDFPFCFAAVRLLGVDRIGHYEHVVVESVKQAVSSVWPRTEDSTPQDGGDDAQGRLAQAEERNKEEASIWTQLALAYAIHKSFIFIRVPLTAAVTPKVVKMLRRWGWDIGKRKPKSP